MKKEISKNGVIFEVDNEKLVSLTNNCTAKTVVIPRKLAFGIEITSIGNNVCKGVFEKITISDEITDISESAFAYSMVEEVCWSKGCRTIPKYCFFNSIVKIVSGIENVETVEEHAFMDTHYLEKIRWPSKCKIIPEWCFYGSAIEEISNTDHVVKVEECAFSKTGLIEFKWPTGCKIIPIKCFSNSSLKEISNIEDVEAIKEQAFFSTNIKKFYWPPKCKKVYEQCFYNCKALEEVIATDNIEEIEDSAFEKTGIKSFAWPAKCSVIPDSCFYDSSLKAISNTNNVLAIEAYAFGKTEFDAGNKLDLSEAIVSRIGLKAFTKLEKEAVNLPYYLTEDIELAFYE